MKTIVSFSGGKDSTAMLIRMLEMGERVDEIIFADTKYEFPAMFDYIEKVNQYIKRFTDLDILTIRTDDELEDWIFGEVTRGRNKGMIRGFPLVAYPCYWSRQSKVYPLDKYMDGHTRCIGLAVDEKHRMAKNYQENHIRYPLIEWGWTEQDCLDYLKERGLHNPLYDEFDRLGCWWCPKQSIKSFATLYKNYPHKWKELVEVYNRLQKVRPDTKFTARYTLPELEERILEHLDKSEVNK